MTAVVEQEELTVDDARDLTDRIKLVTADLWSLIVIAYEHRAWAALGYETWDEYIDAEFHGAMVRLPREERTEVVASLRDSGLSIRAIATAVGVGVGTVHRDLDEEVEAEIVDEPAPRIKGKDGKTYGSKRPRGTKTPEPETRSTATMLSVARPDRAGSSVFDHADNGVGFGNPDFGACVFMGDVQWFSAGSFDEITPGQARLLAACLLAAAEAVELEREV